MAELKTEAGDDMALPLFQLELSGDGRHSSSKQFNSMASAANASSMSIKGDPGRDTA